MPEPAAVPCPCGDADPAGCLHLNAGYPFCRPCGEHHRAPECPIDVHGQALAPCGCPWDLTDAPDHYDGGCPVLRQETPCL